MSWMPERPGVREDLTFLPGYHSPQVDVTTRLNTNESPFPPPQEFFDRLADFVRSASLHRYPDREAAELRAAIAKSYRVKPENVFCGNGSNEVMQTLLLAYGGTGRTAVTFEPTYALHTHIARITGTAVLSGHRTADHTISLDQVAAHAPKADVLFLCSPNNPSGVVDSVEVLDAALEVCNGVMVVDEAYGQFAQWSAKSLLDEERPLVVIRTFSKTWALAGVRLGYLLGPAWLVEELWKTALPYHLSTFTQAAGKLALEFEPAMRKRVDDLVNERDRVSAALADLPVQTWPSQANFILFRPLGPSGAELWQRLLDRSVLVRNCSTWPGLEDCLRVTIGTPEENDRFLAALAESLS